MRAGGVVCVQHWPSMCEVLSSKPYSVIKRGGGEERKKNASLYQKHFLAFVVALFIAKP